MGLCSGCVPGGEGCLSKRLVACAGLGPPKLLGQAWLHGPPPAGLAPLGVKERCVPPKPPVVFPKVTS